MANETYEMEAVIDKQTEKAILLKHQGDAVWLPKSQIELKAIDESDRFFLIRLPLWLAQKKGLV